MLPMAQTAPGPQMVEVSSAHEEMEARKEAVKVAPGKENDVPVKADTEMAAPTAAGGKATGKAPRRTKKQQQEAADGDAPKPKKAGRSKAAAAAAEPAAAEAEAAPAPDVDMTDATADAAQAKDDTKEEPNGGEQADDGAGDAGGRRRAAAKVRSYKEPTGLHVDKSQRVVIKEEPVVAGEQEALAETGGLENSKRRRLTDFQVVDAAGEALALERALLVPEGARLQGVVHPAEGELSKAAGRRVDAAFGPLKDWTVTYTQAGWALLLHTEHSVYQATKPHSSYRKVHAELVEQLDMCHQVYLCLHEKEGKDGKDGGSMSATFEQVVAKLTRAHIGKAYGGARDALLLSSRLVLAQLTAMSKQAEVAAGKGPDYRNTPFGNTLAEEAAKSTLGQAATNAGGAIQISEEAAQQPAKPVDALEAADAELAARLQARMDAEDAAVAAGGPPRGRRPQVAPYIAISPEEIAEDYPGPQDYDKEVEEQDELLMADPADVGTIPPEDLPKFLLNDFAFYDSEGLLTSLELVPMFTGVDHDVDIYGSGVIRDDTGDFAAGGIPLTSSTEQPAEAAGAAAAAGGGGSGGGATEPGQGGGERLCLSQIREWCVESGADMVFINIRTDVAWYKLLSPQVAYAPWFHVVVKAAKLAVAILALVDGAARASRLSFADVMKRLSDMDPAHPSFISKKVDRVHRFAVVHGQIILNQFKHYPNKAVQRSAFVTELKAQMELRKHCKLYMAKAKAGKAAAPGKVRANPMRSRHAVGLKAKPMPATATRLVKAVWHSYFQRPADEKEVKAAEAAGLAQEVPEPEAEDEEAAEQEDAVENALAESPSKRANKKKGGKAAAAKAAEEAAAVAKADKAEKAAAASKADEPSKKRRKAAAKEELQPQEVQWPATPLRDADAAGRKLYGEVRLGATTVRLGDVVLLRDEEAEEEDGQAAHEAMDVDGEGSGPGEEEEDTIPQLGSGTLGLVACLYQSKAGKRAMQVRVLKAGVDTMLGDAAGEAELFLTKEVEEVELGKAGSKVAPLLVGLVPAQHLTRAWDRTLRLDHYKETCDQNERNAALLQEGKPQQYFYRSLYCPQQGMFCTIPPAMLCKEGHFIEPEGTPVALGLLEGGGFIKAGVNYKPGDVMYLHPQTFDDDEAAAAKPQRKPAARKAATKKKAASKRKRNGDDDAEEEDASSGSQASGDEASSSSSERESEAEEAQQVKQQAAKVKAKAGASKAGKPAAKGKKAAADAAKPADKAKAKAAEGDEDQGQKAGKKEEQQSEPGDKDDMPGYLRQYLRPDKSHKGGANQGLKPFALAQLVEVKDKTGKLPSSLVVRRLYRPEDVSRDLAYSAGWWDCYAGPLPTQAGQDTQVVQVESVVGKAAAKLEGGRGKLGDVGTVLHTFLVVGSYDPQQPGKTGPAPTTLAVTSPPAATGSKAKKARKAVLTSTVPHGPDSDSEDEQEEPQQGAEGEEDASAVSMRSLDIFAGCGGLSEGMHQAGVATAKWGIEYEPSAADAFKLNNPDAKVFANNCNVLLRAAMARAGLSDDCDACTDAVDAAAKLSEEYVADLPQPGEVEFIMGGPPCQGYSGMNRFNKGNWSMVQNSMVMAYLSYADFYRPRYFLLENVRNFVSHNKSLTFRLAVRSLLEMGYQVRFGVLNAGNFGVPQSRKRTIIWAAAPNERLPEWPRPRHVFHSPQLTINLPGGVAYTAVPAAPGGGAPLRAVTVRDAIWDLPEINNGHEEPVEGEYTHPPVSAYQKWVRGKCTQLSEHVCKTLNALNLERCRNIPVGKPGADWRELALVVRADPSKEFFDNDEKQPLVPWCLPHTAHKHNGWRGLFGRLDPEGHFPTSTTDPHPMGKVGQVFHPTQHRIVSVRECARAQGFPDTFRFFGHVNNKHRQVGNAVPPPLAFALGSQLRVVLEERRKAVLEAAMAAQLG